MMKIETIITGEIKGDDEFGLEVTLAESPTPNGEEMQMEKKEWCEAPIKDKQQETAVEFDNASDMPSTAITKGEQLDEEPEQKQQWYQHPRITELYLMADWWTLWIGLFTFGMGVAAVFLIPLDSSEDRSRYVIPQPKEWQTNPLDAWDVYNIVGIPLLLLLFLALYLVSLLAMGKLNGHVKQYVNGFVVMAIIATLTFWMGRNEWCSDNGLGYAVFAIVLGMMAGNIPVALGKAEAIEWIQQKAAKDGEYFIKCSLVLLAVELTVLIEVGGPAMIVSWIGSPLAIVAGFVIGTKLFGCKDSLSMLIAVGASWCGASAISAVAPIVMASSEEVALSISVVACFTIIFTFAQPYIAIAVGMPDDVAGAWIGASVDQTGNVIVSAAIISDEATEVAGIVKMVLNAGMGVMASVISCYWSTRKTTDADGNVVEQPKFRLIMVWDKFPKFTLGFIITSAILTGIVQATEGTLEAEALPGAVSTLNKWWFAIAFVGIGITTNVNKLFKEAWESGIIQVYLVSNTIDILLALVLAYSAYAVVE